MSSIRHVWSVLCAFSIIDSETQNISIFNVLEQLNLGPDMELPMLFGAPFQIVSFWVRDNLEVPARGEARIAIVNPSGGKDIIGQVDIDLTTYLRLRQRTGVEGFPLSELGQYEFKVEFRESLDNDFHEVASIPLAVLAAKPKEL